MVRSIMVSVIVFVLSLAACKPRNSPEIDDPENANSANAELDIDALRSERDQLIRELQEQRITKSQELAELTIQRDELNAQRTATEIEVTRIKEELANNRNLTEAERQELQNRLQKAENDLGVLNQKLEANKLALDTLLIEVRGLSSGIDKLTGRLDTITAQIDRLERELAKQQAGTPPGPSAPENQGAAGPPPPAQVPVQNPTSATIQNPGKISTRAWQFYFRNTDNSESCFEFASTSVNAALLGLPCVTPGPTRQLFKTEEFPGGSLWVDQRTQMCMRLDPNVADPATARILLGACKRDGDTAELWRIVETNIETGEFKIRNVRTNNCLAIGTDRRISQITCSGAAFLLTKP